MKTLGDVWEMIVSIISMPHRYLNSRKDLQNACNSLGCSSEVLRRKKPCGEKTRLLKQHAHMVSGRATLTSFGTRSTIWKIPDGRIMVEKDVEIDFRYVQTSVLPPELPADHVEKLKI